MDSTTGSKTATLRLPLFASAPLSLRDPAARADGPPCSPTITPN